MMWWLKAAADQYRVQGRDTQTHERFFSGAGIMNMLEPVLAPVSLFPLHTAPQPDDEWVLACWPEE